MRGGPQLEEVGISRKKNSDKVWAWDFYVALLYKPKLLANFPS